MLFHRVAAGRVLEAQASYRQGFQQRRGFSRTPGHAMALGNNGPQRARSAFAIEALAHFLAGLEERNALLLDGDVRPGARIAPGAGRPVLDRKGAEAAQLDAIAAGERGDDLAQDGIDDVLDVALIEMRVLRRDTLDELGFDHRIAAPGRRRLAIPRRRNGPPDTPLAQFALEGCQRAKRPSRLTRSS